MRAFPLLLSGVLLLAAGVPPAAAALKGAAALEENPRVVWLDRYQETRQGREQTDRFTGTYRVGDDGALDLNQVSGDVRVTTGSGREIRLEAVKRVRHRDPEQGKRLLNALRVEVTQVGGRVEVRTVYPRTNGERWSGSVDYTISVPPQVAVSLKTISGDVSVNGVRGEVRAETISGDVEVIATPNLTLAKTVSGNVTARDIAANGLMLGTVSGSVVGTGIKVRTLDAGTVSGDVQLSDVQVERLTAKSLSGNIALTGGLQRGARYELQSHSGDVRLLLPAAVRGFELDASSFAGNVRSDYALTLRTPVRDDRGTRPGSSARIVRGTFGDASAVLAVRTFSGSVVIAKQ